MVFQRSRIVIIDDNIDHIQALQAALREHDLLSFERHYVDTLVGDWKPLPQIRVLFADVNLVPGNTAGGSTSKTYSYLMDALRKTISEVNGPYILALWATDPDLGAFQAELNKLEGEERNIIPAHLCCLKKNDYINTLNGFENNTKKLVTDLQTHLTACPQLEAFVKWENDVIRAADSVFYSLTTTISTDLRGTPEFIVELGKTLYRLSKMGSGAERGLENPRESMNRILVPMLADKILNQACDDEENDYWTSAFDTSNSNGTRQQIAEINSALHVSYNKTHLSPCDLGSVINWDDSKHDLESLFGINLDELKTELKFKEGYLTTAKLKMIQVGPKCDHAQPKKGTLLYLLAVEVDEGVNEEKNENKFWASPSIFLNIESKQIGKLVTLQNCRLTRPRSQVEDWTVAYRLRDDLSSQIIQRFAAAISRPGIISA